MHVGEIQLIYCHTNSQIADIFTKPLSKEKLENFKIMLKLVDLKLNIKEC